MSTAARFETLTAHVDRFTPDDRSDRPALGAIHGDSATLLVEGGASVAHLQQFRGRADRHGDRPPVTAIALTHWHWDHSFGSAAVRAPVIAHADSAAELELQAGYDWSDAALDARVADGRELAFCRDMIKVEIPDRSDLEIVVPSVIVNDRHTRRRGRCHRGDRACRRRPCARLVRRVCPRGSRDLPGRLPVPAPACTRPHLTIAGVRALTEQLSRFDVAVAVEGHDDDVADAAGFAARLAELRRAADLVEARRRRAVAAAGGDAELVELVEFLIAGERLGR